MQKLYTDKYGMNLLKKGKIAVVHSEKEPEYGYIFDIEKEGITKFSLSNPYVLREGDYVLHAFDCIPYTKEEVQVIYTDSDGILLLKNGATKIVVTDRPVISKGFFYKVLDAVDIGDYTLTNPEFDAIDNDTVTIYDLEVLE